MCTERHVGLTWAAHGTWAAWERHVGGTRSERSEHRNECQVLHKRACGIGRCAVLPSLSNCSNRDTCPPAPSAPMHTLTVHKHLASRWGRLCRPGRPNRLKTSGRGRPSRPSWSTTSATHGQIQLNLGESGRKSVHPALFDVAEPEFEALSRWPCPCRVQFRNLCLRSAAS